MIAVLSLLVSILVPTLQGALEAARRASCASRLHHVGLALQLYSEDNEEYYPYYGWPNTWGPHAYGANALSGLLDYTDTSVPAGDLRAGTFDASALTSVICPSARIPYEGPTAYPKPMGQPAVTTHHFYLRYHIMAGRDTDLAWGGQSLIVGPLRPRDALDADFDLPVASDTVWAFNEVDQFRIASHGDADSAAPDGANQLYAEGHCLWADFAALDPVRFNPWAYWGGYQYMKRR